MPAKPPSRRPKAPRKKQLVGVVVPHGTPKQLATLRKLFKSHAVATLGLAPGAVIEKLASVRRRKPRR